MSKEIEAWHFLPKDMKFRYRDRRSPEVGEWLACDGKPVLCENGMHASVGLMDALGHSPGPVICRVVLRGEIDEGTDKLSAKERKVLWYLDAEALLHEFACRCAERALKRAGVRDDRLWEAIEAKRKWVRGEISDTELDAARSAAESAAWSAARSAARSAAWSAARSAARSAAWSAARSAAESAAWSAARSAAESAAWSAAESAEKEWQEKTLLGLIEEEKNRKV